MSELTQALQEAQTAESSQREKNLELTARLGSLLDALPAGVVELSSSGKIAHFNPAAVDLLGELRCGEQWSDVVERAFQPRWDDGHDISLSNGRRVNIDTAALTSKAGQILLLKDVTETRRLQERLNHHQRLTAKTEVAAALAHQIRTPLSAAMLHLSHLRQSTSCSQQDGESVGSALKSLRHMEKLISDMLMYSRDHKFEMQTLGAAELAEKVSAHFDQSSEQLEIFPPQERNAKSKLRLNIEAILSVVQNLIDNAFAVGAQHVEIKFDYDDSALNLRVLDDGPGVPPDKQSEIFEPFVSGRARGTGLGLAIGRAVSRSHGGELVFEPGVRKQGACFNLILPLLSEEFTEVAPLKKAF